MLKLFRRRMSSVRLSDVAEFISFIPGSKTRDVSAATTKKYDDMLIRFQEFLNDDPLVETISRETYSNFHNWLGERGTKAVTTNTYRRRLRAAWNRLRERGVDVCDNRGIFKEELEPFQRSRATSDEFLTSILQLANVRDAAIIMYLASGGFRRQTIPRLRLDNTHIWTSDGGELRIASRIPKEKTSPPRLIIGDNRTAKAVQLWLEIRKHKDSEWLFCDMNNGGQISIDTVSNIFTRLRVQANLPAYANISPHGLRHRFAQQQLGSHDQKIVAQWMGISVETMLAVYAHRSDTSLLVERLGDDSFPAELLNGRGIR